jgi:hypothetical protein
LNAQIVYFVNVVCNENKSYLFQTCMVKLYVEHKLEVNVFFVDFRRLPEDLPPPPPGTRSAANGFDDRGRPEPAPGSESYSSSYSSYYDRFYSKTSSNGAAPPPSRPGPSSGRGGPMAPRGAAAVAAAAAARKQQDQQSMLQTGPIYF